MKKIDIANIVVSIIVSMVVFVGNLNILAPINVLASTDVSNLNPTDSTYAFLREIESYAPECYWDFQQWTIGYGTKCPYTHSGNGTYPGEKGGHTMSESQARQEAQSKISGYVSKVKNQTAGLYMTQNQFDVLVSLCWNTGGGTAIISESPLVEYLKGSLTESQARTQYASYYIRAGGEVLQVLIDRRKREAELFFSDSTPEENDTELNIPYPRPKCSSTHWLGDGTVGSVTGIKTGREVGWLQTALNRANNAGLDVDCQIGPKTTTAIKNFQSKYGLTADGYAGEKTINKLVEIIKSTLSKLSKPTVSVNKSTATTDDTIKISCNSVNNATWYWMSLYKDNELYINQAVDESLSFSKKLPVGSYIADISAHNSFSDSDSGRVTFKVLGRATIHYNVSGGTLASDSEYYTASNGDIYKTSSKAIVAPVWKDGDSHENGLYNASTFKMTRTGWHFLGWSRAKSSGTIFDQHDNTITAADIYPEIKNQDGTVTLYARWDENEYNVIFNANGGTTPTASKSVEYSKTYGNLPTPTRSGYTFNGWYTSASGGTKITADSKVMITSDQTLYAQWKAIPATTTIKTTTTSKTTTTTTVKATTTAIATTLPSLSVEEYEVNLSVKEQYVIKANQTDLKYNSDNTDVVIVSKNGVITAVGNGETIISVSNSIGDVVKIKVKVISLIKGDANNDGEVTVADAVMLQKWLLGSCELTCWQNVDLCEDNRIDVFDLCLMKRMLVENS